MGLKAGLSDLPLPPHTEFPLVVPQHFYLGERILGKEHLCSMVLCKLETQEIDVICLKWNLEWCGHDWGIQTVHSLPLYLLVLGRKVYCATSCHVLVSPAISTMLQTIPIPNSDSFNQTLRISTPAKGCSHLQENSHPLPVICRISPMHPALCPPPDVPKVLRLRSALWPVILGLVVV